LNLKHLLERGILLLVLRAATVCDLVTLFVEDGVSIEINSRRE
jgi:hypothetical protein